MYRDALDKCGVPAKDTVFIDDSLDNLAGGGAAWHNAYFDSGKSGFGCCITLSEDSFFVGVVELMDGFG